MAATSIKETPPTTYKIFPVFKEKLGGRKILILSMKISGNGDLILGLKIAEAFHERVGIPAEQLLLATNTEEQMRSLQGKERFSVISHREMDKVEGIAFQILAPWEGPYGCIANGLPTLMLREMNFRVHPDWVLDQMHPHLSGYSVGIKKSETSAKEDQKHLVGVLPDQGLVAWAKDPASLDPDKRILKLSEVSEPLQKLLKGKHQDWQTFATNEKLYMGYSGKKEARFGFVAAVAQASIFDARGLTVILPGADLFAFTFETFDKTFLNLLKQAGIAHLTVEGIPSGTGDKMQSYSASISESGKWLRVLYGAIESSDMITLWKGVERQTIVTGDQSLVEAISGNLQFAYQCEGHKSPVLEAVSSHYGAVGWQSRFGGSISRTAAAISGCWRGRRADFNWEKLIGEWDALPKLAQEGLTKLEAAEKGEPFQRIENLEKIPVNTLCLLSTAQVIELGISTYSDQIEEGPYNETYQGSKFKTRFIGLNYYLLLRSKA